MDQDVRPLRPLHPRPRPLRLLARQLGLSAPTDLGDRAVAGVAARSEDVAPGDLFVGLPGARTHGATFSHAARRAGAVAVLTDPDGATTASDAGLPVLVTPDPRLVLGEVAGWVHRTRENAPLLLGVTGTDGKTSTVHLLQALLTRLGEHAGLSSTAERGSPGERTPSRLTTPEADELHALLARMAERGVGAAAIEVSAQALVRDRVGGLVFDVAGFTGLTHEHLDDFGDMDAYLAAKARLFQAGTSRRGVVTADSAEGRRLASAATVPVTTLSSDPVPSPADWRVADVDPRGARTRFVLHGPDGRTLRTAVTLPGAHQAANAALALVMAMTAGWSFEQVADAAGDAIVLQLPGRLEQLPGSADPAVFVDVAHTPDAFAKALGTLRPLTRGRLVMVFGADGDRDASKRAAMGRTAAGLADVVVVHDHHSRFEDPARIRSMVLSGAAGGAAEVREVRDPGEAIRVAIEAAGPGGTVLWAGTGRTDYRDVGGVKHPYSFWDEAGAAVAESHRDRVA